MELYTQRYEINGKQYNPLLTWDGAYFQMMMPQIWLNERELMPNYGIVEDHTFIQKVYASKHGIPMVSSSATTDNAYHAFGVPQLSESKVRFKNKIDDGYTGTPHAIALSYIVDPAGAISALKKLKQAYPNIESPYAGMTLSIAAARSQKISFPLMSACLLVLFWRKRSMPMLKNTYKARAIWNC